MNAVPAAKMGQGVEGVGDEAEPGMTDPGVGQLGKDRDQIGVQLGRTGPGVGLGVGDPPAEQDALPVGVSFVFDSATADADPGAGLFRLNNATPASATAIYFDNEDSDGIDQTSWLDSFDDGGSTIGRGTLVLRSVSNEALLVAAVTGSIVDGSGYRKVSISVISATDAISFTAGAKFGVIFASNGGAGVDGLFSGAEAQVTAKAVDLIPLQDASDGNNAKRATAQSIAETADIVVEFMPFGYSEDVTTGDAAGGIFFLVPTKMQSYSLTDIYARHLVASGSGSTGTTTIQINRTGTDMLSTSLTIDALEVLSSTAATPAVIKSDGSEIISAGDYIRVDVDAIPSGGTDPQGLAVALTFSAPSS